MARAENLPEEPWIEINTSNSGEAPFVEKAAELEPIIVPLSSDELFGTPPKQAGEDAQE
jgi:hypothetical protein